MHHKQKQPTEKKWPAFEMCLDNSSDACADQVIFITKKTHKQYYDDWLGKTSTIPSKKGNTTTCAKGIS